MTYGKGVPWWPKHSYCWTCPKCNNTAQPRELRCINSKCCTVRPDLAGKLVVCDICKADVRKAQLKKHHATLTCSTQRAGIEQRQRGLVPIETYKAGVLKEEGIHFERIRDGYRQRGWGRGSFSTSLYVELWVASVLAVAADLWNAYPDANTAWVSEQETRLLRAAKANPDARACAVTAHSLGAPPQEVAKLLIGEELQLPTPTHQASTEEVA